MGILRGVVIIALLAGLLGIRYSPQVPDGVEMDMNARKYIMKFGFLGDVANIISFVGGQERLVVLRHLMEYAPKGPITDGVKMSKATFDGVDVRIYTPDNHTPNSPGVVLFHGGGWVLGSADGMHETTSTLAKLSGVVLVSVNYRVAPEYKFPVPLDDCTTATKYFMTHAKEYGVDPSRVVVAGNSAGGNLAAAVSLRLYNLKHVPPIKAQVLLYPALQALDMESPAYQANGDPLLKKLLMVAFWLLYAQGHLNNMAAMVANNHTSAAFKSTIANKYFNYDSFSKDYFPGGYARPKIDHGDDKVWNELRDVFLNPEFAPLVAKNLSGLPPAYIYTAHCDILRDDGVLYAQKLKEAKVKVQHFHTKTGFHGALSLGGHSIDVQKFHHDMTLFFQKYV